MGVHSLTNGDVVKVVSLASQKALNRFRLVQLQILVDIDGQSPTTTTTTLTSPETEERLQVMTRYPQSVHTATGKSLITGLFHTFVNEYSSIPVVSSLVQQYSVFDVQASWT